MLPSLTLPGPVPDTPCPTPLPLTTYCSQSDSIVKEPARIAINAMRPPMRIKKRAQNPNKFGSFLLFPALNPHRSTVFDHQRR
jgi:hypothetical protein